MAIISKSPLDKRNPPPPVALCPCDCQPVLKVTGQLKVWLTCDAKPGVLTFVCRAAKFITVPPKLGTFG